MPEGEKGFPHPTEEDEVLPPIFPGDEVDIDNVKEKDPRDKDAEEDHNAPERARS